MKCPGFAIASEAGLEVTWLKLTDLDALPPTETIAAIIGSADIIQVSGGNTLFAVRRWRNLGVDKLLHAAMARGCVLCGGSAGCICWFDGGHSDSLAPATVHPDHRITTLTSEQRKDWSYCRVKGLGFIDAFACPHHNQHESHSLVSRAEHFNRLMRLSPGELGLGIDNNACFVVEGDCWRVVSCGGQVYRKIFDNGAVREMRLPITTTLQPLSSLLQQPDFLSLPPT